MNWIIKLLDALRSRRTLRVDSHEYEALLRENREAPSRALEVEDPNEASVFPITALNWKPTGPKGRGVNPGIANGAIGGYETDVINQRYADSAIEESRLHDNN